MLDCVLALDFRRQLITASLCTPPFLNKPSSHPSHSPNFCFSFPFPYLPTFSFLPLLTASYQITQKQVCFLHFTASLVHSFHSQRQFVSLPTYRLTSLRLHHLICPIHERAQSLVKFGSVNQFTRFCRIHIESPVQQISFYYSKSRLGQCYKAPKEPGESMRARADLRRSHRHDAKLYRLPPAHRALAARPEAGHGPGFLHEHQRHPRQQNGHSPPIYAPAGRLLRASAPSAQPGQLPT